LLSVGLTGVVGGVGLRMDVSRAGTGFV